ncbi:MAG: DUF4186 family protein [Candidatus Woesearchaeota archaeon]
MLYSVMCSDPLVQLKRSRFRRNFGLSEFQKKNIRMIGLDVIMDQVNEVVMRKLYHPILLETSIPYSGNPIFVAMHATACSSRKSLFRWHRIPPRHDLTDSEVNYVLDVIYRWIRRELMK